MRVGIIQLCCSDDPALNLTTTTELISQAAAQGASHVFTPEVTNLVATDRAHQASVLRLEAEDETLVSLQHLAAELGIWLNIGSLSLRTGDPDGRYANRSFMISPDGQIAARYDKIHMFDADISKDVRLRESETYRPGNTTVVCNTGPAEIGLTICYDLRFPNLFRDLAQSGAQIITCPSAFTVPSGQAHWHTLLRARAIETGCFVIAAAQTGAHQTRGDKTRNSFGHSLVVDPWGEILADAGTEVGIVCVDLDMNLVEQARKRIPSLQLNATYTKPENV